MEFVRQGRGGVLLSKPLPQSLRTVSIKWTFWPLAETSMYTARAPYHTSVVEALRFRCELLFRQDQPRLIKRSRAPSATSYVTMVLNRFIRRRTYFQIINITSKYAPSWRSAML